MESAVNPDDNPSGGYFDHVRREELRYLGEFEEWERSLSPADRARLGRAASPDLEDHRSLGTKRIVLGIDRDAAESSAACSDWCFEDSPAAIWQEEFPELDKAGADRLTALFEKRLEEESARRRAEALMAIVSVFLNACNLRLQAGALAFAVGLPNIQGFSTMSEWADAHGVSRQALSKTCKKWQRDLELPPGMYGREEAMCNRYKEAQLRDHWRKRQNEL